MPGHPQFDLEISFFTGETLFNSEIDEYNKTTKAPLGKIEVKHRSEVRGKRERVPHKRSAEVNMELRAQRPPVHDAGSAAHMRLTGHELGAL